MPPLLWPIFAATESSAGGFASRVPFDGRVFGIANPKLAETRSFSMPRPGGDDSPVVSSFNLRPPRPSASASPSAIFQIMRLKKPSAYSKSSSAIPAAGRSAISKIVTPREASTSPKSEKSEVLSTPLEALSSAGSAKSLSSEPAQRSTVRRRRWSCDELGLWDHRFGDAREFEALEIRPDLLIKNLKELYGQTDEHRRKTPTPPPPRPLETGAGGVAWDPVKARAGGRQLLVVREPHGLTLDVPLIPVKISMSTRSHISANRRVMRNLEMGTCRRGGSAVVLGSQILTFGGQPPKSDQASEAVEESADLSSVNFEAGADRGGWRGERIFASLQTGMRPFGLLPTTEPTPRRFHAMATDGHSRLFVFGGGADGELDDLWVWDIYGAFWMRLETIGAMGTPGGRCGHTLCFASAESEDPRSKGVLLLFGGWNATVGFLPGVWRLCLESLVWDFSLGWTSTPRELGKSGKEDLVVSDPLTADGPPADRSSHVACVWRSFMFVFGGFSGSLKGWHSDLWAWSLETSKWSQVRVLRDDENGDDGGAPRFPLVRPVASLVGNQWIIMESTSMRVHFFDLEKIAWEKGVINLRSKFLTGFHYPPQLLALPASSMMLSRAFPTQPQVSDALVDGLVCGGETIENAGQETRVNVFMRNRGLVRADDLRQLGHGTPQSRAVLPSVDSATLRRRRSSPFPLTFRCCEKLLQGAPPPPPPTAKSEGLSAGLLPEPIVLVIMGGAAGPEKLVVGNVAWTATISSRRLHALKTGGPTVNLACSPEGSSSFWDSVIDRPSSSGSESSKLRLERYTLSPQSGGGGGGKDSSQQSAKWFDLGKKISKSRKMGSRNRETSKASLAVDDFWLSGGGANSVGGDMNEECRTTCSGRHETTATMTVPKSIPANDEEFPVDLEKATQEDLLGDLLDPCAPVYALGSDEKEERKERTERLGEPPCLGLSHTERIGERAEAMDVAEFRNGGLRNSVPPNYEHESIAPMTMANSAAPRNEGMSSIRSLEKKKKTKTRRGQDSEGSVTVLKTETRADSPKDLDSTEQTKPEDENCCEKKERRVKSSGKSRRTRTAESESRKPEARSMSLEGGKKIGETREFFRRAASASPSWSRDKNPSTTAVFRPMESPAVSPAFSGTSPGGQRRWEVSEAEAQRSRQILSSYPRAEELMSRTLSRTSE